MGSIDFADMKNYFGNSARRWTVIERLRSAAYAIFVQPILLRSRSGFSERRLEIGPGDVRIPGFETINIIKTSQTDFVTDVTGRLPFSDETFDVIYASHVLEHTPWYQLDETVGEWVRVLKRGGVLEIWVPDGLKIARAFCDAEEGKNDDYKNDGWYRFNEERDPARWFSGRMFSYGDGLGTRGHFNFHLAAFSERFLEKILEEAGFIDVCRMSHSECRGYDHGWINLGVKGTKR